MRATLACMVLVAAAWISSGVSADEVMTAVARDGAVDLSGEWRYKVVPQVEESLFLPSTDDGAWPVTLAPARWAAQGIDRDTTAAVVYRRTFDVPPEWQGKAIGISAWFQPDGSLVYVNGEEVDPEGPVNALYADVSSLLQYGRKNLIVVSAAGDGIRELAEAGPPLVGPIGEKLLTKVVRTDVSIPTGGQPLRANLIFPEGRGRLPVVVFAATGHADYSLKDDWLALNDDLARLGYVSLAVAFAKFTPTEYEAVFRYVGGLGMADARRIAMVGAMKATRPTLLSALGNGDVRAIVLVSSARIAEVSQVGERPVLFVCSEKESSVPALSAAKEMSDSLTGPRDILVLPGRVSGVTILDANWNRFRAALRDWLAKYLE